MVKIFLSFPDFSLEKKYTEYCVDKNKPAALKLLIFNISFHIAVGILSFFHEHILFLIMSFCNIPIIVLLYGLFILYKTFSKFRYSLYIYVCFSIIVPFAMFSAFVIKHFPISNGVSFDNVDFFILGFCFKMYVSHIYLFKMNWVIVIILKCFISMYIIGLSLMNDKHPIDFQSVILIILTLISFIFDFQKEKNDRQNFLNEYLLKQNYENFKKILEKIPDQVLIYQKNGLVFANEPSFELFKAKNLSEIHDNINKNFEIQNIDLETIHDENSSFDLNSILWKKIQKLFNSKNEIQVFVANEKKVGYIDRDIEYDVVLKKILWENEISIMVLFSKVNEKNMKARLNFVNSFLTLVLGNVSHEINTPIHIIQGNLENLKQEFKNEIPYEMKIIKRFIEILNIMMEIMVDLFNIRKGDLYLKLSKIQTNIAFNEIIPTLEECFPYKKIKFCLKNVPPIINTDLKRMKNIFIFVLNKLMQKMEEGEIEISFLPIESSCCKFYKILITCKGRIKLNEIGEIFENDFPQEKTNSSSPFIKSPKKLKTHEEYDFYLINPLVFSLSCGTSEIIDEKCSFETIIQNEKQNEESTSMIYSFKLSDFGNHETLKLKDPFREKHHFSLHFIHSEENNLPILHKNRNANEISLISPDSLDLRRKLKILNVDDMLFSLIVISNYCHKYKLFVEEAKNGLEACKAVEKLSKEEKTFDLIFMDIDMPIMNGLEASKKINEFLDDKKMKRSIILAITANASNKELIESCESNGITEVFKKPLSLESFEEIIKKYLNL